MAHKHPTVPILHPSGEYIDIDEDIAPLIKKLWELGYNTSNSCQDNYVYSTIHGRLRHFVWIEFDTTGDYEDFVQEFIGDDVDRYITVSSEWETKITIINQNFSYDRKEDMIIDNIPLDLKFATSVRFSKNQLKEVEERFGI